MNSPAASSSCLIYPLLIVLAAALVCGHIAGIERVYEPALYKTEDDPSDPRPVWPPVRPEPMPTLRSNDRSRWATVRALVDHGTYAIGRREPSKATPTNKYGDEGIVFESGWESIDKVLRPDTQEFYSSKPPILPTLVAGEYWLLKKVFGWSITDETSRWLVVRTILLTVNLLPLILYLVLLARLVERYGTTDWGRLFVIGAAGFATFLTTFSVTLNNHTVAAWCAMVALYALLRAWPGVRDKIPPGHTGPGWLFAMAGFFAAFTACNELPAASFAAAILVCALALSVRKTLLWFVPAAVVPVAAFFVTNYLAIGQWTPAYGEFGGPWYEYEGSYWQAAAGKEKRGIDWAFEKETRAVYVAHFLAGHHGIFSLTPIWLLALAGIVYRLRHPRPPAANAESSISLRSLLFGPGQEGVLLAGVTLALTVVVVGFYLLRPRWNYAGWTVGPRWVLWLTPLWLLVMLPIVDELGKRRWGRVLALVLLAISVLSANYPGLSPWRHPWIYDFMNSRGWLPY